MFLLYCFMWITLWFVNFYALKKPNKCGIFNCNGNYNKNNQYRVYRLPIESCERQKWIDVLPQHLDKLFICERHWDDNPPLFNLSRGSTRPAIPSSVFHVPTSCLPTSKPALRPPIGKDKQLAYFLKNDTITSLDDFNPERNLQKQHGGNLSDLFCS